MKWANFHKTLNTIVTKLIPETNLETIQTAATNIYNEWVQDGSSSKEGQEVREQLENYTERIREALNNASSSTTGKKLTVGEKMKLIEPLTTLYNSVVLQDMNDSASEKWGLKLLQEN